MRAVVDVGTNTVRMLLGENRDGMPHPVRYFRKITRLGGDFRPGTGLSPDAMERTLAALKDISRILATVEVESILAVGTAALRQAPNGEAFVERVRNEAGLPLEIIAGEREARLCARGVLSALAPIPACSLLFDIGGGSTEFVLCQGADVVLHRSYPLGVVGLAENFPLADDQGSQIDKVLDLLEGELRSRGTAPDPLSQSCLPVGTAGTVTTLAALRLKMRDYDWSRVNNLVLAVNDLRRLEERLKDLSPAEREALPGMEKGRGDLILPGLQIVLRILERFGKDRMKVSDFGLLEGLLLVS